MDNCILTYVGGYSIIAYDSAKNEIKRAIMRENIDVDVSTLPFSTNLFKYLKEFIVELKSEYPSTRFEIFGSSILRKIQRGAYHLFVQRLYNETGCYLNIVERHIEKMYIHNSISPENKIEEYSILHIGSQHLQILFVNDDEIEMFDSDFGTSDLIKMEPALMQDEPISLELFNDLVRRLTDKFKIKLESFEKAGNHVNAINHYNNIYYVDRELSFLRSINCEIVDPNNSEDINSHYLSKAQYKRAIKRFCCIDSLDSYENDITNKNWYKGSRACSIIALSIFNLLYNPTIFPKDSSLVSGIFDRKYAIIVFLIDVIDSTIDGIIKQYYERNIYCIRINKNSELNSNEILNFINICDSIYVYNKGDIKNPDLMIYVGYGIAMNKKIMFHERFINESNYGTTPVEYIAMEANNE